MLGSRFSQRMETLVPLRSLDVLEVYVEVVRRMCIRLLVFAAFVKPKSLPVTSSCHDLQ